MRILRFLHTALFALFVTLLVHGGETPDSLQTAEMPVEAVTLGVGAADLDVLVVDLGIRVVSLVALDGTVVTIAIGRADDANFMATYPTAKPLYFAAGNLIVDSYGVGRIGRPTDRAVTILQEEVYRDGKIHTIEYPHGKERDLFGWADTTGWKSSERGSDYPVDSFPKHISGNPAYDIARAKLGAGWRLPTIDEWAFLVERVAEAVPVKSWSPGRYSYGTHDFWKRSLSGITFRSRVPGIVLRSRVVGFTKNAIFLPAAGLRRGHIFEEQSLGGYYWSGSEYDAFFSRFFYFYRDSWYVDNCYRSRGFSVRPVSE